MTLAKLLSEARGGRHQQEIADRLDVSQATISGWENGDHFPSRKRLRGVAKAYGVDFERLLMVWVRSGSEAA